MATYQPTTQDIAERLGYPWPPADRRTHRVRTLGWEATTVGAVYLCLGLPRPVTAGRGGRHHVAEPGDVTQPISMLPLSTGPHAIWAWAS